nr:MAG TPA: hypothetical protein [Caudoviricetes sp.]
MIANQVTTLEVSALPSWHIKPYSELPFCVLYSSKPSQESLVLQKNITFSNPSNKVTNAILTLN